MSKYEYANRLKDMLESKCEAVKTETKISQKSIEYYKQMCSLKSTLVKQEHELEKYRHLVKSLRSDNDKLEKLKHREEDRFSVLTQKIKQIQGEYFQTQQRIIEQRRMALFKMDCLRNVQHATQTYINFDSIPQLIQGIIINENASSSEWNPFRIDPSKHSQKEVDSIIWGDSHDSVFKKTWQTLIFSEVLSNDLNFEKMETGSENK